MGVRIRFADSARGDLDAVRGWYAERGVPDVGMRLVAEIMDRVQSLTDHPDLGRVVPEFGRTFLRELVHPPFGSCIGESRTPFESYVSGAVNADSGCLMIEGGRDGRRAPD